jgi:hypothetical protein
MKNIKIKISLTLIGLGGLILLSSLTLPVAGQNGVHQPWVQHIPPIEFHEESTDLPPVGLSKANASSVIWISSSPLWFPAGYSLVVADGAAGTDHVGNGRVIGGDGTRGTNIIIIAPLIVFEGEALLKAGDGGRGGHAKSLGKPDAWAQGGSGGAGGRVLLNGHVIGTPTIIQGNGGNGGNAAAVGDPACQGTDGTDQSIRGEDGEIDENGESATAMGTDAECGEPGGKGGDATARGGNGGLSPMGRGGNGGDATAMAGRGGSGKDYCTDKVEYLDSWLKKGITRGGDGGLAGTPIAEGGNGGDGQIGGDGGNAEAYTESGRGGQATYFPGGQFLFWTWDGYGMTGGDGGSTDVDGRVIGGTGGSGINGGAGGQAHGNTTGGAGGEICEIDSVSLKRAEIIQTAIIPFGIVSILIVGVLLIVVILRHPRK